MLQGDDFKNIDPNIQREVLEFVHQYINMYVASDSWYRISCKNYPEYQYCPGDMLLNWKDRGYCLLFDLLQVSTNYFLILTKHLSTTGTSSIENSTN